MLSEISGLQTHCKKNEIIKIHRWLEDFLFASRWSSCACTFVSLPQIRCCPCGLLWITFASLCLMHVSPTSLQLRHKNRWFVCLPFVRNIFASFFCFFLALFYSTHQKQLGELIASSCIFNFVIVHLFIYGYHFCDGCSNIWFYFLCCNIAWILALVIQAIQTLISAIVEQSLFAAVGAPPVPVSIQGLPITAQSSNYPVLADTSIISQWPTCPSLYYVDDTFQASWYKLTQLSFALKVSKRKFLNACYFSHTM